MNTNKANRSIVLWVFITIIWYFIGAMYFFIIHKNDHLNMQSSISISETFWPHLTQQKALAYFGSKEEAIKYFKSQEKDAIKYFSALETIRTNQKKTGKGYEQGLISDEDIVIKGGVPRNQLELGPYYKSSEAAITGFAYEKEKLEFEIENGRKEAAQKNLINNLVRVLEIGVIGIFPLFTFVFVKNLTSVIKIVLKKAHKLDGWHRSWVLSVFLWLIVGIIINLAYSATVRIDAKLNIIELFVYWVIGSFILYFIIRGIRWVYYGFNRNAD